MFIKEKHYDMQVVNFSSAKSCFLVLIFAQSTDFYFNTAIIGSNMK